jgi:preprotein translocase subunit SecA
MLGLQTIARKIFGTTMERKLKSKFERVKEINALEPDLEGLRADQLRANT